MFEVITQANPDDYQSLEILKEAYWKIGRQDDGLAVTRRLADTYMRLGQYSSALLEYEGILQQEPDSKEVQKILSELEEKLHQGKSSTPKAAIALDFGEVPPEAPVAPKKAAAAQAASAAPQAPTPAPVAPLGLAKEPPPAPSLIATSSTQQAKVAPRKHTAVSLESDGNEPLAKFLVQHRLASHEVVNTAMARVQGRWAMVRESQGLAASLLDEISKEGVDIEGLISGIIDRTKFAYVPLEYYDVDRQIVKMLPESLTLGRIVVPFDIVSRTMMIAVDNPFDAAAKSAVQQTLDYHIQWHLATPSVLLKILRDAYRISE